MKSLSYACLAGLLSTAYALSPPVIAEGSNKIDASSDLSVVQSQVNQIITHFSNAQIQALSQVPSQIALSFLPVTSPSLSSGKVKPHAVDAKALPRPIFMIGSDATSVQWLATHHDTLQKLKAVGLLVQVSTEAELTEIQQTAAPLVILPMSGEFVAKQLGVAHYPILITPTEVVQ